MLPSSQRLSSTEKIVPGVINSITIETQRKTAETQLFAQHVISDILLVVENEIKKSVPAEILEKFRTENQSVVKQALLTLKAAQYVQQFVDTHPQSLSPDIEVYEVLKKNHLCAAYSTSLISAAGFALNYLFAMDKSVFKKNCTEQATGDQEIRITVQSGIPYLGGGSFIVQRIQELSLSSSFSSPSSPSCPTAEKMSVATLDSPHHLLEQVNNTINVQKKMLLLLNAIETRDIAKLAELVSIIKTLPARVLNDMIISANGEAILRKSITKNFPPGITAYSELLQGTDINDERRYSAIVKNLDRVINKWRKGEEKIGNTYCNLLGTLSETERFKILIPEGSNWLFLAIDMQDRKIMDFFIPFISTLSPESIISFLNTPNPLDIQENTILMKIMVEEHYDLISYFLFFSLF